jgi:hypothetical protein
MEGAWGKWEINTKYLSKNCKEGPHLNNCMFIVG